MARKKKIKKKGGPFRREPTAIKEGIFLRTEKRGKETGPIRLVPGKGSAVCERRNFPIEQKGICKGVEHDHL